MSKLRRLPPQDLRPQRWANDAGTTTVLASGPQPEQWLWRLSIAHIEHDGPFSELAATRRQLVTLDAPVQLTFPDGRQSSPLRLACVHFDGADAPLTHLPDGPTRAFNLMLRDDAHGELIARPLNGTMWLPRRHGWIWFVHLLSGSARIITANEQLTLSTHDNVWIEPTDDDRVRIEGGGELVLVQLAT